MVFKLKVILLTTKTLHHQYMIQKINYLKNVELIVFFIHKKNYKNNPKKKFEIKEYNYEKKNFFKKKFFKFKNKTYYINNLNSKTSIDLVKKINPNLGILFGTKKVNTKLINAFKKKLINVHRGIMQKYRGLDSEYWALYNKDFQSIGATVHYVNQFLDKGKIIFEKKLKLNKNIRCHHLKYITTLIATRCVIKTLKILIKKKSIKVFKKQKVGKYYSFINNEQKKVACKNLNNYFNRIS